MASPNRSWTTPAVLSRFFRPSGVPSCFDDVLGEPVRSCAPQPVATRRRPPRARAMIAARKSRSLLTQLSCPQGPFLSRHVRDPWELFQNDPSDADHLTIDTGMKVPVNISAGAGACASQAQSDVDAMLDVWSMVTEKQGFSDTRFEDACHVMREYLTIDLLCFLLARLWHETELC